MSAHEGDHQVREDLTVRAYRFENDKLCRKGRFAARRKTLGDRFFGDETLQDSDANQEVLAFLQMRLLSGTTVV